MSFEEMVNKFRKMNGLNCTITIEGRKGCIQLNQYIHQQEINERHKVFQEVRQKIEERIEQYYKARKEETCILTIIKIDFALEELHKIKEFFGGEE